MRFDERLQHVDDGLETRAVFADIRLTVDGGEQSIRGVGKCNEFFVITHVIYQPLGQGLGS